MSRAKRTGRASLVANGLLATAALALVCAAAYPTIHRAVFEHRLRHVIRDVDAIRASAIRYRRKTGRWPTASRPGVAPPDMSGLIPAGVTFAGRRYRLAWEIWQTAARPGARGPAATGPPSAAFVVDTLAGITLQSTERPLLAALLEHYGPVVSFARDSSWTLMVRAPRTTASPSRSVPARGR